jgi:23S rRNA pseudouridine1911/1915/1917 synthase
MSERIQLKSLVPPECHGQRFDLALSKIFPNYSRTMLKSLIVEQKAWLDGKITKPREKVVEGQEITLDAEIEPIFVDRAENIPLNIIYEDDDLLVINKPAGLVVHPGAGIKNGTLLNGVLHHLPNSSILPRAGIVHRLDKDTSGLLVIAKTLPAHTFLIELMQTHGIARHYHAFVSGELTGGGTISAPIGRDPKHRTRMAVTLTGKEATTHYRLLERFHAYTYIKVTLETGRTHQIRVHMASERHPILGDTVYAGRAKLPKGVSETLRNKIRDFPRQALHATELQLIHPRTKEPISFTAKLPEDMQSLLEFMRAEMQ